MSPHLSHVNPVAARFYGQAHHPAYHQPRSNVPAYFLTKKGAEDAEAAAMTVEPPADRPGPFDTRRAIRWAKTAYWVGRALVESGLFDGHQMVRRRLDRMLRAARRRYRTAESA